MRLDRNVNENGMGKYAILVVRRQETPIPPPCLNAAQILAAGGYLNFGIDPGQEFFVLKLKDKYAADALRAYAEAAMADGEEEFGRDVMELANKSAEMPDRKKPD